MSDGLRHSLRVSDAPLADGNVLAGYGLLAHIHLLVRHGDAHRLLTVPDRPARRFPAGRPAFNYDFLTGDRHIDRAILRHNFLADVHVAVLHPALPDVELLLAELHRAGVVRLASPGPGGTASGRRRQVAAAHVAAARPQNGGSLIGARSRVYGNQYAALAEGRIETARVLLRNAHPYQAADDAACRCTDTGADQRRAEPPGGHDRAKAGYRDCSEAGEQSKGASDRATRDGAGRRAFRRLGAGILLQALRSLLVPHGDTDAVIIEAR